MKVNDLTNDIAAIRKTEQGKRITRLYNEGYIILSEALIMLTDLVKAQYIQEAQQANENN